MLTLLVDAEVSRLVDVRIRAQSRKPGFSKTTLAAGLATVGIEYEHLRDLGTPLDIRARFRAKETAEAREEYRAYLRGDQAARLALETLARRVAQERVAILCFEHDHRVCHRAVIAEELAASHGIEATHLGTKGAT
ncbi:MAG: hypothetical protein JWO69_48 [Thermoleophilia bacterium]|nr:hypothetical protein [Thermoleophilia bacterium]